MRDTWDGNGTAARAVPAQAAPAEAARANAASGARFDTPHHIYCSDLDLFGPGSLYPLLSAARTPLGEDTLAQWLLSPASLASIIDRRAAVADLRERLDLREELAIGGESLRIDLSSATLIEWSGAADQLDRAWIEYAAPLLPCLAISMGLVWAIWDLYYPLLAVLLVELAVTYFSRTRVAAALTSVENAYEGLKDLSLLLRRIEAERFDAAPLRSLVDQLSSHNMSASRTLAKLATVANFVEARRNPLLTPLVAGAHVSAVDGARGRALAPRARSCGPILAEGPGRVRSVAVLGALRLRTSGLLLP